MWPFTLPPKTKNVWVCTKARAVKRSIWNFQELVRVQNQQKLYLGIFHLWPEVRSISRPPHYRSNGINFNFFWMSLNAFNMLRIMVLQVPVGDSTETYHLWPLVLPRSSEVTNGFSAITFDWQEIEPPDNIHCVCLVNADQMIYTMTYLG